MVGIIIERFTVLHQMLDLKWTWLKVSCTSDFDRFKHLRVE